MKEEISEGNESCKRSFIETARRAQIIECAINAIAKLGFTRASLAQIAELADVSTSVILYYFNSKKELIREVRTHISAAGNAYIEERVVETSPIVALRQRIEVNVALHRAYPNYLRAVTSIELARSTESDAPQFDPAWGEPRRAALRKILEWGQRTGEFRSFDIKAMIRTITAAIDSIQWQLATNPDFDFDAYGQTLVELFDRATRIGAK